MVEQQRDEVCSFCDKPRSEVATMVSGNGAAICNECLAAFTEVVLTGLTWTGGMNVKGPRKITFMVDPA